MKMVAYNYKTYWTERLKKAEKKLATVKSAGAVKKWNAVVKECKRMLMPEKTLTLTWDGNC